MKEVVMLSEQRYEKILALLEEEEERHSGGDHRTPRHFRINCTP